MQACHGLLAYSEAAINGVTPEQCRPLVVGERTSDHGSHSLGKRVRATDSVSRSFGAKRQHLNVSYRALVTFNLLLEQYLIKGVRTI